MFALPKLADKSWFKLYQVLLVEAANTRYGRQLLEIWDDYPVVAIHPASVTHLLEPGKFLTVARTSSKHANVVRHRWKEWQQYSRVLQREHLRELYAVAESLGRPLAIAGAEDFFPDPGDPAAVAGDTRVARLAVDEVYNTIHDGAGTFEENIGLGVHIKGSATTNQFLEAFRGIALFDTSNIPDGNTIDSATYELVPFNVANGLSEENNANSGFFLCECNPASNTTFVNADYNVGNWPGLSNSGAGTNLGNSGTQASLTLDVYNALTVNATGLALISKTGVTPFGVVYGFDMNRTAPSWATDGRQRILFEASEFAGTSKDPKLAVAHSSPGFIHSHAVIIS